MKTWKVNLKHLSNVEYQYLREICRLSKNVYNESVYNIRQHYFSEGTYLRYESNYYQMKTSENYILLGANVAQQTMKSADQSFKSFFALRKKSKQGTYESWKVRLPGYLPKDGFHPVVFTQLMSEASANGEFTVPVSFELRKKYVGLSRKFRLKVPNYIQGKRIHQIQVIPKYHGKYFEARFLFDDVEAEFKELDPTKALAIDLGVDNFATCATSDGKSFIIDGRKLKSINQWYNKENARLSSIKDLQGINGCTKRQYLLARKRNRRIDDFIYKSAKYIISYCINNHIGNLVVGYNDGFQDKVDMGKVNNQKFTMLPYGKFKDRLQYL
jgi:IS605 OrfB family transposase